MSFYGMKKRRLNWKCFNQFPDFKIKALETPRDGNCLFHSILMCISRPYHYKVLDGKKIKRSQLIKDIRADAAEKFTPEIYESVFDGNLVKISKEVEGFDYLTMKENLRKNGKKIGYGFLGYISDLFSIDIIILNEKEESVYMTDEVEWMQKGRKTVIILYTVDKHYEPVIVMNNENKIWSYLSHDSLFATMLKSLYVDSS